MRTTCQANLGHLIQCYYFLIVALLNAKFICKILLGSPVQFDILLAKDFPPSPTPWTTTLYRLKPVSQDAAAQNQNAASAGSGPANGPQPVTKEAKLLQRWTGLMTNVPIPIRQLSALESFKIDITNAKVDNGPNSLLYRPNQQNQVQATPLSFHLIVPAISCDLHKFPDWEGTCAVYNTAMYPTVDSPMYFQNSVCLGQQVRANTTPSIRIRLAHLGEFVPQESVIVRRAVPLNAPKPISQDMIDCGRMAFAELKEEYAKGPKPKSYMLDPNVPDDGALSSESLADANKNNESSDSTTSKRLIEIPTPSINIRPLKDDADANAQHLTAADMNTMSNNLSCIRKVLFFNFMSINQTMKFNFSQYLFDILFMMQASFGASVAQGEDAGGGRQQQNINANNVMGLVAGNNVLKNFASAESSQTEPLQRPLKMSDF